MILSKLQRINNKRSHEILSLDDNNAVLGEVDMITTQGLNLIVIDLDGLMEDDFAQ